MLRTRNRAPATTAALTLALTSLGLAAPVSASPEHEAPIDALFDIAESGDFDRVGEVVCEAEREAIVAAFDFGAELGVDDQAVANALSFEVLERTYEMLSDEPDTAVVQVTGSLRMSVDEDQVDDVVRAMLESEQSPDDPPVSDEDVAQMAGFMGSALNQTQSVDQEVTVVLEDGAWLVCGGLVDEPEPDPGFAASVSTDGLCALATPAELTAVGSLTYDSSSGFEVFCNYSTSDFDEFHSVGVNLQLDADAEDTAAWFEADQPVQVGEYAGLATTPGTPQSALFLQVGPDLLQLTMSLPETPPEGFDWLTHATAVAGLFAPQVDAFRLELLGPPPDPTPVPTPEISLCEALTLEELNALTELGFDDASGDSYYCSYSSLDGEPGFHSVQLSLAQIDLDGYRAWLPEPVDGEIAGMPALITEVQVVVELPGRAWTLAISGWVDSNDETADLTTEALMVLVAELGAPRIDVPVVETQAAVNEVGGGAEPFAQAFVPTLAQPLCEYVDLEAINALGLLTYDEKGGFLDEYCTLSTVDYDAYHDMSILQDVFSLDDIRLFYPDGQDVEVAGLPAFIGDGDLWVDTAQGLIAFKAILTEAATAQGITPEQMAIPVAEIVVPLIEADA